MFRLRYTNCPNFVNQHCRRRRTALRAGLLGAAWLLAACGLQTAPAAPPTPAPAVERTEPVVEPVVAPTAEPTLPQALVNQNANVRRGPGTDHAVAFWLETATEVTVVGRNADGTWLLIEAAPPGGESRMGWIFAGLTDLPAERLAELTETTPAVEILEQLPTLIAANALPTPTPEPPPAAEPEPEPEVAPEPPSPPVTEAPPAGPQLTVTGNPVNVREGPGTGHPIAFQAAAGDRFTVTGRNADGSWLQVADPRTAEGRLWIHAPLTNLDAATVQTLAEAQSLAVQVKEPPPAQPAAAPAAASSACPDCYFLPNYPERAVKSVPGVSVLYHAPGTYSRDLPGLDYEFELVLGDDSTLWNWRMRDPEACYDALRVHMGDVPRDVALERLEVLLTDATTTDPDRRPGWGWNHSTEYFFPLFDGFTDQIPWSDYPDWDHPNLLPSDFALARVKCFDRLHRLDNIFCEVTPEWGNSGSIHLDAAVIQAIASAAAHMSKKALYHRYSYNHPEVLRHSSYLYPVIDDRRYDNPAGPGPCMEVTRAR